MKNIATYCENMRKSLLDKIFFIDKVDCNRFVDYGCADGAMIHFLAEVYPDNDYLGYDYNPEMIDKAGSANKSSRVRFTTNKEEVLGFSKDQRTTLIASSILHELYDQDKQDDFWMDVKRINPEYVVVRDMCVSRGVNRMSDSTSVARVVRMFDTAMIERWERKWGNLHDNRSLVHFLLKYRFTENWDTEFGEDYLPYNYEELLHSIPPNYRIVFNEHYVLQFVKNQVCKDFCIDLQDRTHVKLVLQKIENSEKSLNLCDVENLSNHFGNFVSHFGV